MSTRDVRVTYELKAIPPETTSSLRDTIAREVREALSNDGYGSLLESGEIDLDVDESFPAGGIEIVLFALGMHFLGSATYDSVKAAVKKTLEKKAQVEEQKDNTSH